MTVTDVLCLLEKLSRYYEQSNLEFLPCVALAILHLLYVDVYWSGVRPVPQSTLSIKPNKDI